MKKLLLFLLLTLGMARSVSATDITISAGTVPDFRATNIGTTRTGTLSVTNGSTSVTCSACIPASYVGKRGYKISIASTDYYVSATASTSALTLSSAYAGSTNASASFSLYPAVTIRFYASISFLPLNGSSVVQAGAPGSGNFYMERACSVIDGVLYIPELTLPATTDPAANAHKNARWSAWFHRLDGGQIQPYGGFESFVLPTATPTTWPVILTYNTPFVARPPNNNTFNTDQVLALIPDVATLAEVEARTDTTKIVTPARLATQRGKIKSVTYAGLPATNYTDGSTVETGDIVHVTDEFKGFYKYYGSSVGWKRLDTCISPYDLGIVSESSSSASANQTILTAFHTSAPSNGACLQFPEGNFYFTTGFAFTKPIQVLGVGGNFWNTGGAQKAGTTIIVNDGASGITFTGATAAKGGRVANLNLKTLTGFSGQTTGYGIWTDATITVENVSISGFAIDGLFFAGTTASSQNPSLSKVDTVHVFDVKRDGIHIDGGGDSNLITILNPNVTRAGRHGIYDAGTNNTIINAHVNASAQVTASSHDYHVLGSTGIFQQVYSEGATGSNIFYFDTGAVGYIVQTGITGAPTFSGAGAALYDNHYIFERGYLRDLNLRDTTDAGGGHDYRLYSRTGAIWAGGLQLQDLTASKVVYSYNPSTTTLYASGMNAREFSAQPVTPSQITSNQNNYTPTAGGVYRLSSDAARDITGWAAAAIDGTTIEVRNVGSFNITLKNQSASSTAANRFICDGGLDLVIGANQGAQLRYDSTTARWRVTLLQ